MFPIIIKIFKSFESVDTYDDNKKYCRHSTFYILACKRKKIRAWNRCDRVTRVSSCIEEGSPTNKTVATSLFGNREIERSRDREIAIRLTASKVLNDAVVPYLVSCSLSPLDRTLPISEQRRDGRTARSSFLRPFLRVVLMSFRIARKSLQSLETANYVAENQSFSPSWLSRVDWSECLSVLYG